MPFDPAPKVKTKFQELAEAMLRGCAIRPIQCVGQYTRGRLEACAVGALVVGAGKDTSDMDYAISREVVKMMGAYQDKYGSSVFRDNDSGMSREQIAARIAAL
jgi:hypothetical protein